MSEYIIKNGNVFDPVQGIKGDKADVAIKDGKIVDKVGSGAKVIDAKGKTVMAGAVEIHAHIAGPKINMGRIYRPEDKLFTCTPTKGIERMGGGASIPTTFKTGYEYAKMGYTTAMEAAMPPLFSRHVHEEIRDTPIIDEGAYPGFWEQLVRAGVSQKPGDREYRSVYVHGFSGSQRDMRSSS